MANVSLSTSVSRELAEIIEQTRGNMNRTEFIRDCIEFTVEALYPELASTLPLPKLSPLPLVPLDNGSAILVSFDELLASFG